MKHVKKQDSIVAYTIDLTKISLADALGFI